MVSRLFVAKITIKLSENDNCHCAGTTKVAFKVIRKRKALRRARKTDIEGVDVTCWDRLFQVCASATGKEGPITDGGQPCTTDIQRQWGSRWSKASLGLSKLAVYSSSSARYDGAVPCWQLYIINDLLDFVVVLVVQRFSVGLVVERLLVRLPAGALSSHSINQSI